MTGDIPPPDHHAAWPTDDNNSRIGDEPFSDHNVASTSHTFDPGTSNGCASNNRTMAMVSQWQPAEPSQTSTTHQANDDNTDSSYHLKWIPWNGGMIPIVMQSINGPCPLIATMNVLLLREKIKLPNMLEQITESQLLAYIGESIMDSVPAEAENDENILLNLEQNINDAIEILPKLKTGLDVNIRFTGITDFEYTPECIIFDLLRIPMYHGWLSDPDLSELQRAIGQQSYNQLVDNIITNKSNQDPAIAARVLVAEEFLEKTASQLTLHGLNELRGKIKDNEIGILFRNNHFLTLFKREGEIYTLVTDHGYLTEDNIVWETLDNIEGAGRFFDANFQLSEMTNRQVSEMKAIEEREQQMVNDYLFALSFSEEETKQAAGAQRTSSQSELALEVAKNLQEEEHRYYAEMAVKKEQNSNKAVADASQEAARVPPPAGRDSPSSNLPDSTSGLEGGTIARHSFSQDELERVVRRSIWENDHRSAREQADSWNNQLNGAKDSRPQQVHPNQTTSASNSEARICTRANDPADSSLDVAHPASQRDDFPVPSQRAPSTAPISSQNQQRQSSGGSGRRSRSEKTSKESNCIVQ